VTPLASFSKFASNMPANYVFGKFRRARRSVTSSIMDGHYPQQLSPVFLSGLASAGVERNFYLQCSLQK